MVIRNNKNLATAPLAQLLARLTPTYDPLVWSLQESLNVHISQTLFNLLFTDSFSFLMEISDYFGFLSTHKLVLLYIGGTFNLNVVLNIMYLYRVTG